MKTVEIYDPALCCSSGVCGPSPDQALAAFAGVVEKLKSLGVSVKRFNLAQEPLAFAQKQEVKAVLEKQGENGLPLVFVDGELFFRSVYPNLDQLSTVLGLGESKCCEDSDEEACCSSDNSRCDDNESDCCSGEEKKAPISFVKVEAPKASGSSCCDPSTGCC